MRLTWSGGLAGEELCALAVAFVTGSAFSVSYLSASLCWLRRDDFCGMYGCMFKLIRKAYKNSEHQNLEAFAVD